MDNADRIMNAITNMTDEEIKAPPPSNYYKQPKFNAKQFADTIMEQYTFKTFSDTKEILIYKDGCYRYGGDIAIESVAQKMLGEKTKTYRITEIINYIRRATYVDRTSFDTDPEIINLKNGLLNIITGEISKHTPKFLSLVQLPLVYDPDAKCPKILKFLREILTTEEDVRLALEVIGYLLYRSYPIPLILLLYGPRGANGKSTFINLLIAFVGEDNVASVSSHALATDKFALAELYGKLLNACGDVSGEKLETTDLKKASGGDRLNAQKKYGQPFEFTNYAKLIFGCNKLPDIKDASRADTRRTIVLPFMHQFDGKSADPKILEKITTQEELSGLLNLAIKALQELLERGEFTQSEYTRSATNDYHEQIDHLDVFISERIKRDSASYLTRDELRDSYREWCEDHDLPPKNDKEVFKRVREITDAAESRPQIDGKRTRVFNGIAWVTI